MKASLIHVRPNVDFVLSKVFSAKLIGGLGVVYITAPLPALDYAESPYKFVAITIAYTLDPHGRLKGDSRRISTGIVHVVEVDDERSQLFNSVE